VTEILGSVLFGAFALACAAGLMWWHLRCWRDAERRQLDSGELEYRRRQFRRRMQIGSLMALLGATIPLGHWILLMQWPKVGAVYWSLVVLVVLWLAFLALADFWASKLYFGRLHDRYLLEQTRLQAQLRRIRSVRGNGRGNGDPRGREPEIPGRGPQSES